MRDFFRHGSMVFAGTVGANALFYISYALVQRSLGLENAGLFMALLAATQLLAIPGNVAATVVAKMAADATAAGQPGVLRALARQTSLLAAPLIVGAAIAAAVLGGWLQAYFHAPALSTIFFALLAFAFFFPLAPQRAVFQGGGYFAAFIISGFIEAALKAATGLALLLWSGSVSFAFAGFALATAVAYVYNAARGSRTAPYRSPIAMEPQAVKNHVIGVVLPIAGLSAVTFADAILVRHYLSPQASGLYAVAALLGRAIVTVTQFVPTVLMPKAAAAAAAGRSPARLLLAAAGTTGAVVLPILAIVAVWPGPIATALGGRGFAAAAPLILPYSIAMSAVAAATVLATYLIAANRRAFAVPMTVVCGLEIAAIIVFHPDVYAVVKIVLTGHCAAFACVLAETLWTLRRPNV